MSDDALESLRAFGLRYPGAHTKSPWPGHKDLAVNDKTFAYLSLRGQALSISCKLPHSGPAALMLPFAQPTGYGLGKSGWVSADFPRGTKPPLELLQAWIDESYRAQAPKKLLAALDASKGDTGTASPKTKAKAKRKPALTAGTKRGAAKKKTPRASTSKPKRGKSPRR